MRNRWLYNTGLLWLGVVISIGLLSYLVNPDLNADKVYQPPGFDNYLGGTDNLGRPLILLILQGIPVSIAIAIVGCSISLIIAIVIGGALTYLGNQKITVTRYHLTVFIFLFIWAIFLGVYWHTFTFTGKISSILLLSCLVASLALLLKQWAIMNLRFKLPIDFLGLKATEIVAAVPLLFVVLALASVVRNTGLILIIILGLTSWTRMARLMRGEVLLLKNMPFVLSAEQMGFSYSGVFVRHILPNSITPIVPSFTFGIASMIIVESSLSFIGIGLPPDALTLGKLIRQFYENPSAWWLGVYPGVFLVSIVLSFHAVGDFLHQRLRR